MNKRNRVRVKIEEFLRELAYDKLSCEKHLIRVKGENYEDKN
ncbi:hypothetical protein SDC9_189188 [bioreactor metagenome]|uniref:Uncharacterized protein n=1 Tax=bioreactor metagenome TaxID=1076179 RepID=A0A645HZQ4_9ZZZZ